MIQKVFINDYAIFPFSTNEQFLDFLESGNWNNILIALNSEKLIRDDSELRSLVNENIGYPDGIGAVWALKRLGKPAVKIPGAEFWLKIIEEYHSKKSFYLIGGKPEVLDETIRLLKFRFPNIKLIGFQHGYFDNDVYKELLNDVVQKKPNVVFVAMGSPKQEKIMKELQSHHKALYMGLGGSFDVFTGFVKRAPKSWINLNLEWAYRLLLQPSRIYRQRVLLKFLYRLLTDRL